MALIVVVIGILAIAFQDYWILLLALAFAATAVPPLLAPAPRVTLTKAGVEIEQRKPLLNSHVLFPVAMTIGAVGVTIQAVVGSPTGGNARLPFIAVAAWVLVALTLRNAVAYRGKLVVEPNSVSVPGRFELTVDGIHANLVQQRKLAFPYLELTNDASESKPQLIFPTMCYGLEANSLTSTVLHLSETDPASRSSYSPELIREMLLFKPDREVAVGDSIEVRVVAQPRATTP
ncbi:hypothetical protein [Williamsia maris]|uniref:DUF58 domain-containing protein n=1 Tax=Williamsia maris TaxID=72806 RepID=A0ABT1HAQ1_9NOCA|nr:hypothetical protein [Williamsia maris]MCP2174753.1 hypothetical protein [Williamsia maris]